MTFEVSQSDVYFVGKIPGFICVKNIHYRIAAITESFARAIGWNSFKDAIGTIDHEMPCRGAEAADEFIKLDKACMSSGKELSALQAVRYQTEWRVLLTQRQPIFDDLGNVTQMWITAVDVTQAQFSSGLLFLNQRDDKNIGFSNKQTSYIISSEHQPLPLSPKQEQFLFLLIRGKTMKSIAIIMGISARTVETHIELIKAKLKCYSKSQLIEKALQSGFYYYIPKAFLNKVGEIISN